MTLIEHLEELRWRLIGASIAFFVMTIVAYTLYAPILHFLLRPVLSGKIVTKVYVPGIVTGFLVRLKVSVFAGFVLALPIILYEVWRFVTPGLESSEKRYAIPFVLSSVGLFAFGALCAFLIMPVATHWLLQFAFGPGIAPLVTIDQYFSFVIFMVLAFGLTFEFPLLLVFLALAGVLSSATLRKYRRHAVLGAAVVGAVATPSQDPYSMIVMAVPLYILYELSILVIRWGMKK